MQYFVQAFGCRRAYPDKYDLLMDIATEEFSHLEIVGATITMLLNGVNGAVKDAAGGQSRRPDRQWVGQEEHVISDGDGQSALPDRVGGRAHGDRFAWAFLGPEPLSTPMAT